MIYSPENPKLNEYRTDLYLHPSVLEQFAHPSPSQALQDAQRNSLEELSRMIKQPATVAFIPMRCQPFTGGHEWILKAACEAISEYFILGLGSANISRTNLNPWTATERVMMIHDRLTIIPAIGSRCLGIIPLRDVSDDGEWRQNIIEQAGHLAEVIVSNNAWVTRLFEGTKLRTQTIPDFNAPLGSGLRCDGRINATQVRESLRANRLIPTFLE